MNSHVLAFALALRTLVLARDIDPDWNKLTDFTTDYNFDFGKIIAFSEKEHHPFPFKSCSGSAKLQLDVAGERFKIVGDGTVEYSDYYGVPPPLRNVGIKARGEMAFDAKGFVWVKEKGSVDSKVGPFSYEFCAKVNFPQGLLPPGQMIMSKLDEKKAQIKKELNAIPHTEASVDGSDVALFERHPSRGPGAYAAIGFDGTPVGFGMTPPANGKWDDAIMKFSGWKLGAGTIEDGHCVQMTATELLQSHHANRSLWVFDQMLSQLKDTEPLSAALGFVPAQPSQIFASAARLESLEVRDTQYASVQVSPTSTWATVAFAAVGGVIGAAFVLVLSKTNRAHVRDRLLG